MLFSDTDIKAALESGRIRFSSPIDTADIRPAGIRVHLAATIACPESPGALVDLQEIQDSLYRNVSLGPDGFTLKRGGFILASTVEKVSTSRNIIAQLDGRSTLARLGVMVHCGSTMIDNVHEEFRSITLEVANVGPYEIKIRAGDCIGMLFFSSVAESIEQHASPQYRGQSQVTPPKMLKAS